MEEGPRRRRRQDVAVAAYTDVFTAAPRALFQSPAAHLRCVSDDLSPTGDAHRANWLSVCGFFGVSALTLGHLRPYSVAKWRKVGRNGVSGPPMLRGATKVTLDAKGRLAIPVRYRERLLTRAEGHLVATIDQDRCLLIYPLPDWEEIERKLTRLPALVQQARRLQGLMLGHATELDMDSHGRILLPRELRTYAGLDRQAMLIGQGNKFELWDEERWNARREQWLADAANDQTGLPQELEKLTL